MISDRSQRQSTKIAQLEGEISQKMLDTLSDVSQCGTLKSTSSTLRRKARPAPRPPRDKAPFEALERALDGIEIRHPSELVLGIVKTVATQWRHAPQQLLPPGVCYRAQVRDLSFPHFVPISSKQPFAASTWDRRWWCRCAAPSPRSAPFRS